MYPLLHGMERSGYLRPVERSIAGRPRKYYRITPAGRRVLAEARRKMTELVNEVRV